MKYIILLLAFFIGSTSASATVLTGLTNVDNGFNAYISTSDSTLGTLIGSGANWGITNNYNATLTPGLTQYLHVVASNWGGPGGFLGAFTLSDSNFTFANNTNTLLTGDAVWRQNLTGFGNAYSATVNEGLNGIGPWGYQTAYGANRPSWIWNYNSLASSDFNTVYFSATINSNAVPEPATYSMLLAGLGLIGFTAWRRKSA
jgi:hypothetical protein